MEQESKKVEVDIKMTLQDLYRFNLYHTYHSSQGILSVALAVMIALLGILTWGDAGIVDNILYLAVAVLLLVYVPINLYSRAKKQIRASEVFQNTIHYIFDETGITTVLGEQSVTMPWTQLYKIVSTRRMLLLYGARIRANVIPRNQLGDSYDAIYELARSHMESYRFKMKK